MKWVSPIKDEKKLQSFCDELEKIDEKYLIMFQVGIGTGLQLQEILRLRVGDVRQKDYFKSEIGTRDVRRDFHIPRELRQSLDKFTEGKDPDNYLIYGHGTRMELPLSREQAYRVLKEAGKRAGIEDVGATTMRKTFAWRYYQRTGDIYYLQDLMNHSSPTVTYRYIGIEPPRQGIGITVMSAQENAKARARLYRDGIGVSHLERIKEELTRIQEDMQSPKNPDAWFGKTESLLHSIDILLDEYRSM